MDKGGQAFAVAAWLAVVVLGGVLPLHAQDRLGFQGRLTDTNGDPVANQNQNLTFGIYQVPATGTRIWREDHSVSLDPNGVFSVVLGSETALPLFDGTPRYLEIAIDGGSPLTPRVEVTPAPFALNAVRLDGLPASAFARAASNGNIAIGVPTGPQAELHVRATNGIDNNADLILESVGTDATKWDLGVLGRDGEIHLHDQTTGTVPFRIARGAETNSLFIGPSRVPGGGGNVGIGTDVPFAGLHIRRSGSALTLQSQGLNDTVNIQFLDADDVPGRYKWDLSYRGNRVQREPPPLCPPGPYCHRGC